MFASNIFDNLFKRVSVLVNYTFIYTKIYNTVSYDLIKTSLDGCKPPALLVSNYYSERKSAFILFG